MFAWRQLDVAKLGMFVEVPSAGPGYLACDNLVADRETETVSCVVVVAGPVQPDVITATRGQVESPHGAVVLPVPHTQILVLRLKLDTLAIYLRIGSAELDGTMSVRLDHGRSVASEAPGGRDARVDIGQQIGQILRLQELLKSIRHQRFARACEGHNIGA